MQWSVSFSQKLRASLSKHLFNVVNAGAWQQRSMLRLCSKLMMKVTGWFHAMILLKIDHESDVMMMHHLSHGFTFRIRRHDIHATQIPRTKRQKKKKKSDKAVPTCRRETKKKMRARDVPSSSFAARHYLKWQWRFLWAPLLLDHSMCEVTL